ncbi:MAG TPA: cell division protein ZipA C-terminal FtsZ-binding domain-containing protein [Noviherbaspirillum sp.]|uniref:cell division protein ZipA C-terminal FtsZ-binding domain-containing protein n=1 Tax=Noviherbaspirillum sp. TaxID=1926288 RepID=UPI002D324584|nr:cell division protein ZipA C-terminal FtsZ-binding domain-containing protein [Noviherbaspirillum sp.]HYD96190.1 cell division protein ZipA C-terminal FtsZ-binding domain-containing protein [Noviherbaspirillum sp.]
MTELQASLMAIGGTIVVGVITYNKWQEYKAKKSVQRAFSSEHDDVLMQPPATAGEGRQEPSLAPEDAPAHADVAAAGALPQQGAAEPVAAVPQKELPVDDLIDCSISLTIEAPVRGEKLLPKLQTLRHVGNKPVHFIGQREDGGWEPVAHGSAYHSLFAGVQLANRSSPLNEIEYSELIARLRQLSDDIDADLDVPDMGHVMARARSLHQFVAEHDAQLSVNVQSKGAPWAINTLLSALERQGFDLRPDGRLVMPDGDGGVLFSLSTNVTLAAETTSRLTLLLDVPRVAPLRDGFGAMTACARMLAARLDGVVVDDGNQPLSDAALNEIAEQVAAFYSHMENANIAAGSTRALRLFS